MVDFFGSGYDASERLDLLPDLELLISVSATCAMGGMLAFLASGRVRNHFGIAHADR